MKFVVGAMKFFGKKDGQTCADFSAECKDLTPSDRSEMAPEITAELRKSGQIEEGDAVESA